jgi:large subunit ribosomal protein L9
MKVILLKTVKNLGQIGDIKEVNNGHAMNYLIPQKFAEIATKHSLMVLESQKRKIIKNKQKEKISKNSIVKKINRKSFDIKVKTDEKGTLYAGLDKKKIILELEKLGFNLDPKELLLQESIKKTGNYTVHLCINDQKAKIKLKIVKQ